MLEKLHPSLYSSPNGCLQPVIMSSDLFRAMIANVPISHFEWDVLTSNTSVQSILRTHEQNKKREYNQRVIEIEHGTFTPLIFTTSGAMGHECSKFHKTLAEKMSKKTGEKYEDIMR